MQKVRTLAVFGFMAMTLLMGYGVADQAMTLVQNTNNHISAQP